ATATAVATTTTIISCNNEVEKGPSHVADKHNDDDVRNVLRDNIVGEIEQSIQAPSEAESPHSLIALSDVGRIVVASQPRAVTETVGVCTSKDTQQHTVKIQIANGAQRRQALGKQISVVKLNEEQQINSNSNSNNNNMTTTSTPYQLCYSLVSSGQYSPCETLDSGTGSDLESIKSPGAGDDNASHNGSDRPPTLQLHLKTTKIRVNSSPSAYSLTDSEEGDVSSTGSNDSLHSNEYTVPARSSTTITTSHSRRLMGSLLPDSLLRDIRDKRDQDQRPATTLDSNNSSLDSVVDGDGDDDDGMGAAEDYVKIVKMNGRPMKYEADQYYTFHVNEHANFRSFGNNTTSNQLSPDYDTYSLQSGGGGGGAEDAFVGYKDVHNCSQPSTIRSSKGTVRGVKNRVRNGVATFLQLQQPNGKNYKDKDLGKVVLYTTSMGIIRETYGKCANVKQILRTLLIKFEERDIFMSVEYQQELRDRMHDQTIRVPQLFVEGQHIGDADAVERLNESGELRQLLKPYKSIATTYTCQTCGGYRLLPCPSCNGSKKSVHRNHFTAEFVALKCMNCDEVGLVKCQNC
ncbi:glutaredoxin domain-containing cysteine-rich protein CG31559, partial [Scaptodrosophila lebanonensis]|uniref:Glutaredoxin domain-containing cysteine-rich protein CG31559 n=1 Tax=Drosophila lebanonensis TaxID=7225 RepID=A0A6J2U272_DROLE